MNKKNDAAAFRLYSTVGHRGLALFRFYMSLHFVLFTRYCIPVSNYHIVLPLKGNSGYWRGI